MRKVGAALMGPACLDRLRLLGGAGSKLPLAEPVEAAHAAPQTPSENPIRAKVALQQPVSAAACAHLGKQNQKIFKRGL